MTTMAAQVEGLRSVSGSTERDALFPSPAVGQKVWNRGSLAIQEWDGAEWDSIIIGSDLFAFEAQVSLADFIAIGTEALENYTPTDGGNIAIGYHALQAATIGEGHTAIGHYALEHIITGSNSTAIGWQALRNSTGSNNTAVGSGAATETTTGSGNVAIGVSALFENTTGFDNVAIGTATNPNSQFSTNTVAIGSRAMTTASTGDSNVAVGVEAMYGNIQTLQGTENFLNSGTVAAAFTLGTGWSNGGTKLSKAADGTGDATSIDGIYDFGVGARYTVSYTIANLTVGSVTASFGGHADPFGARSANGTYSYTATPTTFPTGIKFTPTNTSRFDITAATAICIDDFTGSDNVALGAGAAYMTTSGQANTSIGQGAMRQLTSGSHNVAVGLGALLQNGTGSQNVAVGKYAGYSRYAQDRNVYIGYQAGYTGTTGTRNTAIGFQAGFGGSGSDNIFIGNKAGLYETGSQKLIFDTLLRADEADQRAKAILYGVMDATVGNQILQVNAQLRLTQPAVSLGSGTDINLGATTQTTVGAAGGASALAATPLGYLIAYKGATKIAIPYYNG